MKKFKGKVLLISPYLDVLGGGEKHILSILHVFDKNGYQCDIKWNNTNILPLLQNNLGIYFNNARVIEKPMQSSYDYCIYVTDGSYFLSSARHKYIFFMYPDTSILPVSFLNKIKTFHWKLIANGEYTRTHISMLLHKKVDVLPPYIDDIFFQNHKKEKIILSVGRFFPHLHSKKQEVLITAFIKLQKKYKRFQEYTLVLAGGLKSDKIDQEYFATLKKLAKNNRNIEFMTNIPYKNLIDMYSRAELYWHAAGYESNNNGDMSSVEHFGITPLEAMASGCVVYCHNSGGPKSYIVNNENGFLYNTVDELIDKTQALSPKQELIISAKGRQSVKDGYSYTVFFDRVKKYFNL